MGILLQRAVRHGRGWGRLRAGGNWKFYVHEVQGLFNVTPTHDGKWADL